MNDDAGQGTQTLGPQDILKLLPHRYPFLLVDRIVGIRGDDFAIGIKNVTFNEPFFQGHFPDKPVMPGCCCSKAWRRPGASARCCWARMPPPASSTSDHRQAKFRRPVVPGDVLEYHMTRSPAQIDVVVPRRGQGRRRTGRRGGARRHDRRQVG
jgi:3-hydroxyacyl-[acyl-carrier-protein] dehydratase